jgi:hypothetical protein
LVVLVDCPVVVHVVEVVVVVDIKEVFGVTQQSLAFPLLEDAIHDAGVALYDFGGFGVEVAVVL